MIRFSATSTACVTFWALSGGLYITSPLIAKTAHAQGAAPAAAPAAAAPAANNTGNPFTILSSNCTKKGDPPDSVPSCLIYGPVVIPGKFELSRNRDVLGSASISGFVGYQIGTDIINVSPGANRLLAGWGVGGFLGFSQNIGGQVNAARNSTA